MTLIETPPEDDGFAPSQRQAVGYLVAVLVLGLSVGTLLYLIYDGIARALGVDSALAGTIVQFIGLWIGLLVIPFALLIGGRIQLRPDCGWGFRLSDIPIGIAAGLGLQLVIVPLLYLPLKVLSPAAYEALSDPARDLAGTFAGWQWAVIFVLTVFGAPLVEEFTFRGFLFGLLRRSFGLATAIGATAVIFGIYHFQQWQTLGLIAVGLGFALLRWHYGRLGPSLVAHMTFNATALIVLLIVG